MALAVRWGLCDYTVLPLCAGVGSIDPRMVVEPFPGHIPSNHCRPNAEYAPFKGPGGNGPHRAELIRPAPIGGRKGHHIRPGERGDLKGLTVLVVLSHQHRQTAQRGFRHLNGLPAHHSHIQFLAGGEQLILPDDLFPRGIVKESTVSQRIVLIKVDASRRNVHPVGSSQLGKKGAVHLIEVIDQRIRNLLHSLRLFLLHGPLQAVADAGIKGNQGEAGKTHPLRKNHQLGPALDCFLHIFVDIRHIVPQVFIGFQLVLHCRNLNGAAVNKAHIGRALYPQRFHRLLDLLLRHGDRRQKRRHLK